MTDRLTDEQLDELRKLAEGATGGNWSSDANWVRAVRSPRQST